MVVDVVLPSRRYRVFTYQVPSHLEDRVRVGSTVVVPLGPNLVPGVAVKVSQGLTESGVAGPGQKSLREVHSVPNDSDELSLSPVLLQLVKNLSEYYLAPFSACLPLIVPPIGVKLIGRVFLTEKGRQALAHGVPSSDDMALLQTLASRPKGLLVRTFRRSETITQATVSRLKNSGWIEERQEIRSTIEQSSGSKDSGPASNFRYRVPSCPTEWEERMRAPVPMGFGEIGRVGNEEMFQEEICVGTDSQRWNALIQTVERVLQKNRRAIVLVPEVQQAEGVASRCTDLWGKRVEVFHGDLTLPGRMDQWLRIQKGEVEIVVGTRSAVFLPLPQVGLVWVEGEEDPSYQEEHLPYYHAREVARMRAKLENVPVVFSSALPSVETYARFRNRMEFTDARSSPKGPVIEAVDLRDLPFGTVFSPRLQTAITHAFSQKKPVILFVNRKGFSQGLMCRDCGHSPSCPVCGVTLRLFQRPLRLLCSYCGRSETIPEMCSACQGTVFRFPGVGTQRVEAEAAVRFPSAIIARFDRENLKTEKEADAILHSFREGKIHILIGTEWLFHRMDPPRAGIVGLLQADLGLQVPDFRSAERTYHALDQAVGMAGRGQKAGTVIVQTRMPDHHVLQAIFQDDPDFFYRQELGFREVLRYPPFSHLLLFVITGMQPAKVSLFVNFLQTRIERLWGIGRTTPQTGENSSSDSFLGPIPSKKSGGMKKARTLLLLKTTNLPAAQQRIQDLQQECHQRFPSLPVVFEVHVDPLEIR